MTSTSDREKIDTALAREDGRAGVDILELRYSLEDRPGPVTSFLFGHVPVMFTAMIVSPWLSASFSICPRKSAPL